MPKRTVVTKIGNLAGPFTIDLQLNDGSGSNDANNTAIISHVSFGGGAPLGSPTIFGGAAGSLTSSLSIVDSSFSNLFSQAFTPGMNLNFDLSLTTNTDSGLVPDEFSLSLLDALGNPIPTTGLQSAFLAVDIDSSNPAVQTFAGAAPFTAIGAPTVSPGGPTTVAEPGTLPMLAICLLFMTWCQRRKRAQSPLRIEPARIRSG